MSSEFNNFYATHGRSGLPHWKEPILVTACEEPNRADQGNTIKACEYLDHEDVLEEKMEIIANLIKKSKYIVAYTGAGLSKASGIPDYATKAQNSIVNYPKVASTLRAEPTLAHHILTRMYESEYLHYWVQQNHDGLPQKAGYPQEKMNEIHGAWFDPSNPVVPRSGNLRDDLFTNLLEVEKKTDLCLCLGTSLSGMNADRLASTTSTKFINGLKNVQGTIIINLQKTKLDCNSTIRVWAKLDDAFSVLARKLGIDHTPPAVPLVKPPWLNSLPPSLTIKDNDERSEHGTVNNNNNCNFGGDEDLLDTTSQVFWVPYDMNGKKSDSTIMKLDLSNGSKVVICSPGARTEGFIGSVYQFNHKTYAWYIEFECGKKCPLGWWMIDSAIRGALPYLPLMNVNPELKEQQAQPSKGILEYCSSIIVNYFA